MRRIVLFFAVKQEAGPFCRLLRRKGWRSFASAGQIHFSHREVQDLVLEVFLTGMGRSAVNKALEGLTGRPDLVITAGFCGALNPSLRIGEVVTQGNSCLGRPGSSGTPFYCSPKTVCKAAEKAALWESTGCDAVEMESKFVVDFCNARGIPALVLRTVSDTADADMPLDFDSLTLPNGKLSIPGLALAIMLHPAKIGGLIALGIHSGRAANALAQALFREIETQVVDNVK